MSSSLTGGGGGGARRIGVDDDEVPLERVLGFLVGVVGLLLVAKMGKM